MTAFRQYSIYSLQSSIRTRVGLLVLALLNLAAVNAFAQTWHTVSWVYDGDTILLDTGQRIRYIGINAPEIDHKNQKAQPLGYQARSFNKDRVMSKRIRLEYGAARYDRYGRVLAYVFLADGTFLNARLLQTGLAYYLYRRPNLKYHKILLKAQRDAMALKQGLWHNWKENEKKYTGNRKSRRFHISSCPFAAKINSKSRIRFNSKWDAFSKGYAPSKQCIVEFWSYETGE